MISVAKVVQRIRFKEKDNNEIKHSDYDILQALNECVSYVNQEYAVRNADFLEKMVRVDEVDAEGVELPEDFLTLINVRRADGYTLHPVPVSESVGYDGYKVVGNRLYVGVAGVTIVYKRSIGSVQLMEDVIDLPEVFFESVVKLTRMILNNAENDILLKTVTDLLSGIVPARKYSSMKRRMPFFC